MTAGFLLDAGEPAASVDSAAVTQLVLRERQTRDNGWYDEMTACFTPDATISMSWFNGLASDFIASTRERSVDGRWGRHRLSPPVVRVHRDRAWAELPLSIEFDINIDGVAADLISYCRSQYRAARTDAGWRLTGITSVYQRDTLTASIPGEILHLPPEAFLGLRPSYRSLGWYFAKLGTPLPNDLLGDDDPEPVAELYRREARWLRYEGD